MATGATEYIDSTTSAVFIPTLWSREYIRATAQQTVLAPLVDRRYEKDLKHGDTAHVPSVAHLTAQTKAKSSNAAIVYETATETNVDITVATHEYSAIAIEEIVEIQSWANQAALYAPEQAYALNLAVDDALAALVDDFTQTVGTLAVGLTWDNLLRARQYLDDANASNADRVIVISPAQEAAWLTMDEFIKASYVAVHGQTGGPSQNRGYIRSVFDMPIYKSTNVEGSNSAGHDNAMFQKQAVALVMQQTPKKPYHFFDPDYLCEKIVVTQLHGSKEMRDDHGVFMAGL